MSRSSLSLPAVVVVVVVACALCACAPGAIEDTGAADLTITAGDGEPLQLIHAPGASEVVLTPPVDGEVELLFSYNDPLVDVALRTDANAVAEGDVVELPADALTLEVLVGDVSYASGAGASGTVELQVLEVDDERGVAHVSAALEATLLSSGGDELLVEGFLEGSVGDDAP